MTRPTSHVDLVVLAVYLLGKQTGRTACDTEDVAVKAFELAPNRFSWVKHKEQINLEIVRVSLSDAKKKDKGGLLDGSGKTGWSLTPAGLRWAQAAAADILAEDQSRARSKGRGGSIDEQRWRRERDRIIGSSAWSAWKAGAPELPARDAKEVFRIDSYADADKRMRSAKISRLQGMFADDAEITEFLARLADILRTTEQEDAKD